MTNNKEYFVCFQRFSNPTVLRELAAMEAYFQYQRVRRAVHQQLAELKEDCSCRSYIVGSPHDIK